MIYESLLDLAYISLGILLITGERWLSRNGWDLSGPSLGGISDPLTALIVGLFAFTFFFLVLFVGAIPPMLIHDLAVHGWRFVPGRHAELVQIGPVGNLAQLVGVSTTGYLFFRATQVVLLVSGVFGFLSIRYHF